MKSCASIQLSIHPSIHLQRSLKIPNFSSPEVRHSLGSPQATARVVSSVEGLCSKEANIFKASALKAGRHGILRNKDGILATYHGILEI